MNYFFIILLILGFLTISIESTMFLLQWYGRKMSKWFKSHDFRIHSIITNSMWIITFTLFGVFQFSPQLLFHNILILQIVGGLMIGVGLIVSTWGYYILGLERSLGINFYRDNIERVDHSLYKYFKNPEEIGLLMMLYGIGLLTKSWYNLIFALEFTILMIPHQRIENLPFRKNESNEKDVKKD
ncbi:methyltransferase [Candidatus Lokiarchaeum ossiferum]|uniref:methyltransferase n=1 Tax=Candidatus Lokiarchaeum ossiferum TaxID=2951803 RepID=UPI00352C6FF5